MAEERRRHERILIVAEVRVSTGDGRVDRMPAHDISLGGVFLCTPLADADRYTIGTLCDLALFPSEETHVHRDEGGTTVHAEARVVRRDDGKNSTPEGIGLQ